MQLENILNEIAEVTWLFCSYFLLETSSGNFIWNDPDYGGDNTIRQFYGDYKAACKYAGTPFGRDKGHHVIRVYCGDKLTLGPEINLASKGA